MKTVFTLIVMFVLGGQLQAQVSFILSSSPSVSSPQMIATADVNGDGKVDLICANYNGNSLSVLTNTGTGNFVLSGIYAVGNNPVPVVAVDVNGDGKVDLICANYNGSSISVLTNTGTGNFVPSGTYAVGNNPLWVAAADVNGDGKVDLICANYGDGTLSVLTNTGTGNFVLSGTYAVGGSPSWIGAADVNGNGKVDLICGHNTDNALTVLTNNGSGGFVLDSSFSVVINGEHNSFALAAVNGDGKVDLISANATLNSVSVLTNNGSGNFVLSGTYAVGGRPYLVTTADVNGDGWPDLICANVNGNSLSVLTNNGSGGFVTAGTYTVGPSPYFLAAADVNGDGKPDLISANGGNNTLSVLTNATPFPATTIPVITAQPIGQTNLIGTTATFSVGLLDFGPPSYQWQLAGTNLPAATNNPLILTNLTLSQAGSYDVVVSDSIGSVTSSPAMLDVRYILVSVNGQPAAGTMTAVTSATVTITGGYPGGFLFYTLDGSTPTPSSTLYSGPMTLTNSAVVSVMSLSADFTQTSYAAPVTVQIIPVYNLETSVIGSGTITVNPTNSPYVSNSIVTLTATAALNWAFDYWMGGASGSQNPLNLTMDGPLNVQAVFVQSAYPLTVSTPGGGSVTANGFPISPATYYPTGSVVTLAASASNGWSFVDWQGTASSTSNPLNATISQTNNIQAIFGTVVGTNAVGGGSIMLSQPNPVPYGTILTASAIPATGNYFVTWSGAASGTNAPATITVTNANPTINALFSTLPEGKYSLSVVVVGGGSVTISPQQNYYNPGDTVTLSASTTNAGTNFYGWTGDATATNSSIMVVMNASKVIQANFVALPMVSISPTNIIIIAGSNGVLNASASGFPPLSYQWQNSQGAITDATNASFEINNAQPINADNYSVVVSNPYGSVTSVVATVTVVFPPSITLPPLPQTVAAGTPVTLSVTVTGTPTLYYQWVDSLGPIPDATNSSYSLNPAQTNNWDNYFVIITNVYGAVTSTVTPLVVYGPVTIDAEPMSQVVPLGATPSFVVLASGFPAPVYQWTFNGTNLIGATSNILTIANVNLSNLGYYQALINNGYSTNISSLVTLYMSPSLVSPFTGATTVWGTGATLSVGAVGSGQLSYQWYLNGVAIAGQTGAMLNFPSIQFTNAGLYSVVVSSPYGSITNAAYQVVVNPAGVSLGFYPGLTISGVAGYSYIIQSSTNLANTNGWVTLTNLTLTQPVQLWVDTNVDASSPFNSQTFYQILPGQ